MKKKIFGILIVILLLGLSNLQNISLNATVFESPEIEWSMVFGGSECDEGYSIIKTSDNSYLLAGVTTSYGNGDYDGWLIKTDSDGNEIWNKTYGGISQDQFLSINKNSDNGFIIAGSTMSYGAGDHDVWLIKTDSDGNEKWNRTFGGMGYDFASSVQQTIDSGFILTGVKWHGLGSGELWLIKTSSDGIMEWNKTFDAPGQDIGNSVQQTSDGGYIIGGEKGLSASLKDLWVIRTDAGGNEIWNVSFDGGGKDVAESIQETTDGGFIITGFKKYGSYEGDLWLIKINDTGMMQWDKTFGEDGLDMGHSVVQTTDGGYVVAGRKSMYNINSGDLWIIKTDENGELIWNIILGENPIDVGRSIIKVDDEEYIILGFTESYGNGGRDFWLIKLKASDDINQPPVADADGVYYANKENDFTITLDGSSSYDPDGYIILYEWDWNGDGIYDWSSQTTSITEHIYQYSEHESYDVLVTLRVTDNDGLNDTDTSYVHVSSFDDDPPIIQLIYPTGGEILKDIITVEWVAYDSKDGDDLPIHLFYTEENDYSYYRINDILDNDGEYQWDTNDLPDGNYKLLIEAVDNNNNVAHDSSDIFEIKNHEEPPENNAPDKPNRPTGETEGKIDEEYSFTTSTTDIDGDQLYYKWDWGDKTSGWLGPYNSGETCKANHIWNAEGIFDIKVKAKDQYGDESPWSDPLSITMPKNVVLTPLIRVFQKLIDLFPWLENILQSINNSLLIT